MKKTIFFFITFFVILNICAQSDKIEVLKRLETESYSDQDKVIIATLKQASRLFATKDDLTSVIMVLPAGTKVTVTESDSAYYKVVFDGDEGYIFKHHADIELTAEQEQAGREEKEDVVQNRMEEPEREMTRFEYLEKKYGTNVATQINAGKIWKGMTAQMVRDSWGEPQKINRSITGNSVKEEWIYRNTWLFIENNTLVDWGPIKR
ncbi:MAG: SH3 domain-containing protein [Bacteroidales bacterium]|nr:SH3 domain-containing protein [Bacteroidales bacterium]